MAGTPSSSRGTEQPHTHETLLGTTSGVANNAQAALTWGTSSGPDTLLNISTPTVPTIITTGIYAVTASVQGANFTNGGYFTVGTDFDLATEDFGYAISSNLKTAAEAPAALATATMYLAAGMQIRIQVTNHDGVAARDFDLYALVQRVG